MMLQVPCGPGIALTALVLLGMASSPLALAQRTQDNATAKSDDAFGRSVGNESVGIYNPDDVRGFSPIDAGNVRLEGLYLDRQTDPTQRLIEGSAIRVAGRLLINELMGTGWNQVDFSGTYTTNGGVTEIQGSSGVEWTFTEVR